MERFIATQKIEKVPAGCINMHDAKNCSDCKAGLPCQYAIEGEYIKLGLVDIDQGHKFTDAELNSLDGYTLMDSEQFSYNLSKEQFQNYIREVEQ